MPSSARKCDAILQIIVLILDWYSLSFVTLPFLARDPKAIEVVQVILESVLLRREKTMRDADGKRIVELPAKEVCIPTPSSFFGTIVLI